MKRASVSMQHIAKEIGISKNAVSLALANKPGVGKEMRERVFEVAARMGYKNQRERKPQDARKLLVITPEYNLQDRFFYADIYLGVQKQAQAAGHFIMLSGITESMIASLSMPEAMDSFEFSGVLAVGVLPHDYIQAIMANGIALVAVDNYYDDLPVNCVVTANQEGSFIATSHLIELGHRDIGFIAPIAKSSSFFERWQGYTKAMIARGLVPDPRHSILDPWPLESLGKDLEEIRRSLAAMGSLPSAFVCGNDETAIAVINVLREMGLHVPQDVSVTGFDDIDAARFFSPSLSTYRVPRVQLGQEAVRFLLSLVADRKHEHEIIKRSIYGALLKRDSSGAPRKA
jgi:DNA-binding LacI/PurR family transcriptional regulator